ncbi:MAG: lytic murein transglycosylase [Desulfofustis sp.]|nr:lytic murein transglycosylase [Desulfofustis sp.]
MLNTLTSTVGHRLSISTTGSPISRLGLHKRYLVVLFSTIVLCCFKPYHGYAAEQSKAADLVKDGQVIDLTSERYALLFKELQNEHNFSPEQLDNWFAGVSIDKKVLELMDRQWEAKPYYKYRPLFVTRRIIAKGKKMLTSHQALLDRIEARFGVEREVIIAIWGIESRFGSNRGSFNVFETLNTLFDAYPRRSEFFRKQLVYFLIVCRENNMNPLEIKGSYAGAFGQTQFIPSSFYEYAVSFDDDAIRDVFNSTEDVLASIANYLSRFGWTLNAPVYVDIGTELKTQELISANLKGRKGRVDYRTVAKAQNVDLPTPPNNRKVTIVSLEKSPAHGGGYRYVAGYPNFQAITEWNHSNRYAMAVTELSEAIKIP